MSINQNIIVQILKNRNNNVLINAHYCSYFLKFGQNRALCSYGIDVIKNVFIMKNNHLKSIGS